MKGQRKYPEIYLAIDNCFAYKRWTEPESWAKVISELGIKYIEASADTELDPLYMGEDYISDWIERVKEAEKKYGVKVANLYSGHGTYSTLGLTHTDARVRKRMEERWFKPMIDVAAVLGAGMGFFAHGFAESIMQDRELYKSYKEGLTQSLGRLAAYGAQKGCGKLGVEQMYVPYMIPWTIEGTASLLKEVKQNTGKNFYFTEDLGHHHRKFQMPSREEILRAFENKEKYIWLGPEKAYAVYDAALERESLSEDELTEIESLMKEHIYFFTNEKDRDCYEWLRQLGCYSPIVHLQQTNGTMSAHRPFTETENQRGIIEGSRVLRALKESYDREEEEGMPERCGRIYLTLELFSSTTQTAREILEFCEESVSYWRKFIPRDGMNLAELTERI